MGVTPNTSRSSTQQELGRLLVHRNVAVAANKNMTQDAYLEIVHKTGSSKNKKLDAFTCEYINLILNKGQLTI